MHTTFTNALEKDIIREILNIGLAHAADSFAVIAQGRVLLEVPNLELVEVPEMMTLVRNYGTDHFLVQSDIKGDFNGATLLVFSPFHVQKLTEVCLRMNVPASLQINEMQRSLLLEISNILTGALVTQLANLMKSSVYGMPPTAPGTDLMSSLDSLIDSSVHGVQPLVFSVVTQFKDSAKRIELPLLLFFDRGTFLKMLEIIRSEEFVRESHLRPEDKP